MDARKKISILGAGFGGLRAAKVLARRLKTLRLAQKYEILLIDKNDHHTYTPLLYEVATTSKETATICDLHEVAAYDTRLIVEPWGVTFIQKEVKHIDPISGLVELASGEKIECQFLIIALGSEANYFGIPGLKEYSLPFKTFRDAICIRDMVWNLAMEGRNDIRIIVGGAGPTGVELASEFKNWCGELEKEFKSCRLDVSLVEVSESVLPGLDHRIIKKAEQRLKYLNVRVLTGRKISKAHPRGAALDNGETLPFDAFVWTGGVKARTLASKISMRTEERDRMIVGEGMECLPQTPNLKLASRVYGLGDSVCVYDPITKKPIPGVARAAITQANVVAHNIIEEIKVIEKRAAAPRLKTYSPREYPYIVPVGGKYAAAKIGPIVLSGIFGWIVKGLVELNYLLSIMPASRAACIWLRGFFIFVRNKRLG